MPDLLILTKGDRVPADAVLLSRNDLMVTNPYLQENPCRLAKWHPVASEK